MTSHTFALRRKAFERQGGACYYCGLPMWLRDMTLFAATYGLSLRQARLLQATAEHLKPRQHGGGLGRNIVAACLRCNSLRHAHRHQAAPDPVTYRNRVQSQMAKGSWHPFRPSGNSMT